MELKIENLKGYFRYFDSQFREIRAGLGAKKRLEPFEISVSSLDSIAESIQAMGINPPIHWKNYDSYDAQIYIAGYKFCNEVLLNFLFDGTVPETNLVACVGGTKNDEENKPDYVARVVSNLEALTKSLSERRSRNKP